MVAQITHTIQTNINGREFGCRLLAFFHQEKILLRRTHKKLVIPARESMLQFDSLTETCRRLKFFQNEDTQCFGCDIRDFIDANGTQNWLLHTKVYLRDQISCQETQVYLSKSSRHPGLYFYFIMTSIQQKLQHNNWHARANIFQCFPQLHAFVFFSCIVLYDSTFIHEWRMYARASFTCILAIWPPGQHQPRIACLRKGVEGAGVMNWNS